MSKVYYAIAIVFLVSFFSCTKTNKQEAHSQATQDSIKKYLGIAKNDSLPYEKRDFYNSKAFGLIDLNQNDTLTRYYLSETCVNFLYTRNWNLFNKVLKIQKQKAVKANDTLGLARYYRYIGGKCLVKKINDSAFYYYLKSEKLYKKTNDKEGLYTALGNKVKIQQQFDDYQGAELTCLKTLSYLKKENRYKDFVRLSIDYANILADLGNYDSAIKKYKEALFIIKNKNLKMSYTFPFMCLNNIGTCYKDKKDYKNALIYFNYVLSKASNLEKCDPSLYGFLHNNIGFCNLKLKKYKNVEMYFNKAAKIFEKCDEKKEYILSQIYLSNYYLETKDTISAIKFSEKALKLSKEIVAPYYFLVALSNAGMVNKEKAPKYIVDYHRINDSLIFQERKARNQYYKIQLETNEITQEKENAIKQKWVITSIIASVLVIVILLFIIYFQRAKQKELKLLQSQQIANEETYQIMLKQQDKEEQIRQEEKKRIALELHDNIMNKLASTRHNLFTLTKVSEEETAQRAAFHIEKIHDIENEIRSLSHDLTKDVFSDTNSFIKLLIDLIKTNKESYVVESELEIEPKINWDLVSGHIKMHLYRIIQEGMHNSNKYAKATKITISIIQDEKNLCMAIEDNGEGFNTKETSKGIGLKNMKERIELLGGKFSIHSDLSQGTKLFMAIPAFE